MIDRNTIEKILEAARIEDIVGEFVTLRRSGTNLKGLCPFHDDKTPSFVVSPVKGLYKCFACGKGGNVVHFIMEHEQLTYPEALKWLANRYHIEIKERELSSKEREQNNARESMFVVNEWACKFYQNALQNTAEGNAIGLTYFRNRGVRDDIIEKFRLGFSPAARDALPKEALARGYSKEYLKKTGICVETEQGALFDRYHGRVMFPWVGISGRITGFGGRVLDSRTKGVAQKYINSPESDIFSKRKELYGIFQAKREIVRVDRVYMVEGYTDVIAMHQCGLENVVANSGTALSEQQVRLLHRFTSNITLLYDGDGAGIKAALRGIDILLAEGMNVRVLLLPNGDDPDSFARSHTPEEFLQYIEQNQKDFITFKTDLLLRDAGNDPIRRAEIINNIVDSIAVIPNRIIQSVYTKECSQMMQINEQLLVDAVDKVLREEALKRLRKRMREEELAAIRQQPTDMPTDVPPPTEFGEAAPIEAVTQAAPPQTVTVLANSAENQLLLAKEEELIRLVVKYGEVRICELELDDNRFIEATVPYYIDAMLKDMEIELQLPIHRQILQEAVEHAQDPDFKAEFYFMAHPSVEISQLTAKLTSSRYTLSRSNSMNMTDEREQLLDITVKLTDNYKIAILKERLKKTEQEIKNPANLADPAKVEAILREQMDIRNVLIPLLKENGEQVMI